MSGAGSIGKKIASAKELGMIVRSMKALAASSIGQYERAIASLDEYHRTVELGLSACLRSAAPVPSPASKHRSAGLGVILLGSDQGLVGRFNEVLFESAGTLLQSIGKNAASVWTVGDRMHGVAGSDGSLKPILLAAPSSVDGIARLVDEILIGLEAARRRNRITDVHVFHNRPLSGAVYEPVNAQILPLDAAWRSRLIAIAWPKATVPQLMNPLTATLDGFIREYFFVVLFRACAESLMSENASRLAAMQRAEKNIDEIRETLARRFHRIRQESIDEELFEVIAGYESMAAAAVVPTT